MAKKVDPEDQKEFYKQVNSEPNLWHTIWEAYPPKVIIENNTFPYPHEVYNCTTCIRGRAMPADKMNEEEYNIYCRWECKTHIGPRWNDIGCPKWDRKEPKPKHGFLPGIES